jgi:hypothetical protein
LNRHEVISWVIFIGVITFGHLASTALQRRLAPRILHWLKPALEGLFPSLKMEPWLFEPIALDDLPPKQRWFFETHTPGFVTRGFTHLGDFVLRRDPNPSCVRFFLSPDGAVIGGLNCFLADQVIECMSVLLDGFYLESASIDCPNLPPARHGLQFFPFPTDDAGLLIEHHLAQVAEVASSRSTTPALLTPADLQAAVNYGRQLSHNSLHQQGVLTDLPDFLRAKSDAKQT